MPRPREPRKVDFAAKDEPLRDDVSLLGALVGEVIREQGGEELFEAVEAARRAAIRQREERGRGELESVLGSPDPARAGELVRAFATYFKVVNLAEKVHRIRRRREYLRGRPEGQPGGLEEALLSLREAGMDGAAALGLVSGISLEPVFTAHPTEATRQTLLAKEQAIARALVDRLDPTRTPEEERAALGRVRAALTAGWQTEEHPSVRPTVADEREHVLFYLTHVLYRIVPPFHEAVEHALETVWGEPVAVPTLLRFATWVGGDMDGNPNVTARTLEETLLRQRALVLDRYHGEVEQLGRLLSQSRSRVGISADLEARLADYGERFPEVLAAIHPRHRTMPYRSFLSLVAARIDATFHDRAGGYAGPADLADDLRLVERSLGAHRGVHAGRFAVLRTLRRVETFGFHLAALDVRQDSRVHREVVGTLLGDAGWSARSAAERAERLGELLTAGAGPEVEPGPDERRTLAVFATIREAQRRFGAISVEPYVISMTEGTDDVLTVLVLARWGGLAGVREEGGDEPVPLDVTPLFETVPDLEAAPRILRQLLESPVYRKHLATRGDRQMVMIGYSDSNKDSGLASSRWALHRAQAALVEEAERAGVELTLFHGQGGSIARGGGKTHQWILAAPPGAVRGRLRATVQGEAIDARFGLRGLALRNLERSAAAVALATAAPPPDEPELAARRRAAWSERMETLAAASRATYRALVYEEPAFWHYFRHATPIDVIERLRIGSRPARRRAGRGVEDLRAIPWVFAWTQSRHLLPGWYGLGSGLAAAVDRHGEAALVEMTREWPFLTALLTDAEMVLATADLAVAERYAALAGAAGEPLFRRIREEYGRTVHWVLRLQGRDELLADEPTLRRAIRLRNPYVDPMSALQVDLLRRWRAAGCRDDDLLRALLATVTGIAEGLQSTG